MRSTVVETIMGAVVIVIAAVFLFFVYSTSGVSAGKGGMVISAQFGNVAGISVGSDVRISGIKVGSVVGSTLDPQTFEAVLKLEVDGNLKLPDDSDAKVTSEGLLGAQFIAITPGGSSTMLKNGGKLTYTQGTLDLWSILTDALSSYSGKSK